MRIKLLVTDIDGVWTDGGMYYCEGGEEFKRFSTSDSVGDLLAREAGIEIVVITRENTDCVKRRMKKLSIESYYLGTINKLALIVKIVTERGLEMDQVAFIGDEINDHPLLKKVGFQRLRN